MFKLIFRAIVIVTFLVFISVALAIWKGGEPFRYFGGGVIVVGKSIVKFGDLVDDFVSGSKKMRKSYNDLKEIITSDDDKSKERADK